MYYCGTVLVLIGALPLLEQVDRATLNGTITDQSGAALVILPVFGASIVQSGALKFRVFVKLTRNGTPPLSLSEGPVLT